MTAPMRVIYGASPTDIPGMDTARLRAEFLVEGLFRPGAIEFVYTHVDRMILGGAVPTTRPLSFGGGEAVGLIALTGDVPGLSIDGDIMDLRPHPVGGQSGHDLSAGPAQSREFEPGDEQVVADPLVPGVGRIRVTHSPETDNTDRCGSLAERRA